MSPRGDLYSGPSLGFRATLSCRLNNLRDSRWPPKSLRRCERHANRGVKSWVEKPIAESPASSGSTSISANNNKRVSLIGLNEETKPHSVDRAQIERFLASADKKLASARKILAFDDKACLQEASFSQQYAARFLNMHPKRVLRKAREGSLPAHPV